MDIPIQGDGTAAREYTNSEYTNMDIGTSADISSDDDYFEEVSFHFNLFYLKYEKLIIQLL